MKLVVIMVAEFFVSHLAWSPWRFTQWMALLWGHNDPMEDILITGLFIIMNKLAYRKLRFKNEFTLLINLFQTDYCRQNIPLVVFWNRPQGAAFLKALKHDLNVIFLHHHSLLSVLSVLFVLSSELQCCLYSAKTSHVMFCQIYRIPQECRVSRRRTLLLERGVVYFIN